MAGWRVGMVLGNAAFIGRFKVKTIWIAVCFIRFKRSYCSIKE
jgi:hypothetical protein